MRSGAPGPPPISTARAIVALAKATGCDGDPSRLRLPRRERRLRARGRRRPASTFVGPSPEALDLFGDKLRAREAARARGRAGDRGRGRSRAAEEARAFFAARSGAPIMLKAVAGGGGRGMRVVRSAARDRRGLRPLPVGGRERLRRRRALRRAADRAAPATSRCRSSATGSAGWSHFGERECTIQRRHQKLIEIAPSPCADAGACAQRIVDAAMRIAREARYDSLGTFEFLVDADRPTTHFAFIEANPRLQVEHTVTEEVFGVDLVAAQIRGRGGARSPTSASPRARAPRGVAIQARVNLETMTRGGEAVPAGGRIAAFDLPSGPGVRVDTFGYSGYRDRSRRSIR